MTRHFDTEQKKLWARLEAFDLDEADAGLPFTARLARENGWPRRRAKRVTREYKKFLFLGCSAEHPVTPSDEVDQAWHLHLVYTRSYWHDLCRDVLGVPFHHGPTRGGAEEQQKFRDWYQTTLTSYRRFFGEPPSDIWPASERRFADGSRYERVDRARPYPKRVLGKFQFFPN